MLHSQALGSQQPDWVAPVGGKDLFQEGIDAVKAALRRSQEGQEDPRSRLPQPVTHDSGLLPSAVRRSSCWSGPYNLSQATAVPCDTLIAPPTLSRADQWSASLAAGQE